MRVVVNGHFSAWLEVTSGVPQGSVLGPLLFLIFDFVYDLTDWIKTNIGMFADDTKILTRITSIKNSADLQKDLDSLSVWSANWQVAIEVQPRQVQSYACGTSTQIELHDSSR